jgi:hypothetical protein
LKELAGDQAYTDIDDAIGKSGLIWVDGDQDLTGGTIGGPDSPAILIINGNFTLNGATIYGIVYVVGTYTVAGNPIVIGSSIVEGTDIATGDPATPPIVKGSGTLTLVFWPAFESTNGFPPGLSAVISGSWRDW